MARSTARICSVVSAGTALRLTVCIGPPSVVLPAGRVGPETGVAVLDRRQRQHHHLARLLLLLGEQIADRLQAEPLIDGQQVLSSTSR